MAKIYPNIENGQAVDINWRKKDYKIACCDCGLVHKFRFAAIGNTLRIRAWRDNRATSAIRRKRKVAYGNQDVIGFINDFNKHESHGVLKNVFTQGYCYYFSIILRERFPGGKIVYSPVMGHFMYLINNTLFDITGIVKTEHKYYDFEKFPDYLQKQRIIRDCVMKIAPNKACT